MGNEHPRSNGHEEMPLIPPGLTKDISKDTIPQNTSKDISKDISPHNPLKTLDLDTAIKSDIIKFIQRKLIHIADITPNKVYIIDLMRVLANDNVRKNLHNTKFRRVVLEKLVEFKTRHPNFYAEYARVFDRVRDMYSDPVDLELFAKDTAVLTELSHTIAGILDRYHLSVEAQNSLISIILQKDLIVKKARKECFLCGFINS